MRASLILLLSAVACGAMAAEQPLYRYLDPDGSVHYSDKPPSKNARPFNVTRSYSTQLLKLPSAPRFAVHFDTPTPGQTYRGNAPIDVAMSVMPGLISSFRLLLKLDGETVVGQPLRETRTSLPNPGAGTHTLVAVLLNAKGQELTRSMPLKINIKEPAQTP